MLGKNVTYKDFNGREVQDTVYFNLTPAELLELNIRDDLEAVGKSGDSNKIMDTFKRILKAAYGVRTPGGAQFVKTENDWAVFSSGEAYSQIFIQLVTDADYAVAFIRELIPANLAAEVEQQKAAQEASAKTASEVARANSEAQMQGFQQGQQKPTEAAPRHEAPTHEPVRWEPGYQSAPPSGIQP